MVGNHQERTGFLITNMSGGGAERVISNLLGSLSEHNPMLFLFDDEIVYPFDGEIHIIDTPLASRKLDLLKMARGVVRLRRSKRNCELKTCISFLIWPNLFNILSRRNERVIISVRNHPSLSIRGRFAPIMKMLIRRLYPRADHIVAISEDVRRDLMDNFGIDGDKITTIYNPIHLDKIIADARVPLPADLHNMAQFPTIISMGRFTRQKGQWHLLRAFRGVKEQVPNARLLLLGVGPYQEYLEQVTRELDLTLWVRDNHPKSEALEHDVIFWGFSSNPFPILAAADLFAFPSLWEGLGNVVLEALATGLPVVSADCNSGPREILAPNSSPAEELSGPEWAEYGVLLPVCRSEDDPLESQRRPILPEEQIWADTLSLLLQNEEYRLEYSQRGKQRAADFALEKITAQWKALLSGQEVPVFSQSGRYLTIRSTKA